jgi:hypothetical protein
MKGSVRFVVATAVATLTLAIPVSSAFAGTNGYEGQPGNQSNGQHGGQGQPNGLLGYEGQPGNQGG